MALLHPRPAKYTILHGIDRYGHVLQKRKNEKVRYAIFLYCRNTMCVDDCDSVLLGANHIIISNLKRLIGSTIALVFFLTIRNIRLCRRIIDVNEASLCRVYFGKAKLPVIG